MRWTAFIHAFHTWITICITITPNQMIKTNAGDGNVMQCKRQLNLCTFFRSLSFNCSYFMHSLHCCEQMYGHYFLESLSHRGLTNCIIQTWFVISLINGLRFKAPILCFDHQSCKLILWVYLPKLMRMCNSYLCFFRWKVNVRLNLLFLVYS